MAGTIRINALPVVSTVTAGDVLALDGATARRILVSDLLGNSGLPAAFTSVTSPIHKAAGALQFQNNGTTFAGNINTSQQWSFGQNTTPVSGVRVTISDNVTALPSMTGFTPTLLVGGADTTRGIVAIQTYATGNESSFLGFSARGTAASPISTVSGDFLVEFFGHGYTTLGGTPGFQHNSGGGFVVNALENYTAAAQGCSVDIYATPIGGSQTQLGLSVGATNSTFTNGVTVGATGAASGTSRGVAIRTATTGTGAGGSFQVMDDSFTVSLAVANASSLLGTAYDPTMLFYSATNAYRFNGMTAGLARLSSNGTLSASAAYFSASLSANQSTTSTTSNKILCNTELSDPSNWYDNATNFRFTPQLAGKYLVNAQVSASGTTVTEIDATLKFNGTTYAEAFSLIGGTVTSGYAGVTKVINFNGSTDFVELFGVAIGTGTLNFLGGTAPIRTYFEAHYLGP